MDNVPVLPGQPPACSRWLFPTECLLVQAFPVHPIINKGWKVCPFNFPRAERKARQVCAQAGNSMSILCTYICALHGLVCHRVPVSSSDRKRDWDWDGTGSPCVRGFIDDSSVKQTEPLNPDFLFMTGLRFAACQ